MPILYSNNLVEVEENESGEFVLTSKEMNLPNLLKLILAFLVCGTVGTCFGGIAYVAARDLFQTHMDDWKISTFGLAFGLSGAVLAFVVLRGFCWGCLPKGLRLIRNERICVVRNYLVARWSIPSDQIESVGLKIGHSFGGNASQSYYFSRLYILKSGLLKSVRCCAPSEFAKTLHEANSDGHAVGSLVAKALGVPLLHRENGKWIKRHETDDSGVTEEKL
jgi:hypothetical protein